MTDPVKPTETVTDSGAPVAVRIPNAVSAQSIYNSMVKSDEGRSKERARIKGMVDGDRPYSEKELRDKGLSWRSNVNWREAEGYVDGATNSYSELVMELSELVDVAIVPESEIQDPTGEFGQIIAEEYTDTLKSWRKFMANYMIMSGQLHRYGKGMYFWPDPYSWKYKAIKTGNLLVPEDSGVTLDDLDMFMVNHSMTPVEAYALIENTAAGDLGWNTAALKRALVQQYKMPKKKLDDEQVAGEWENIQQNISSKNLGLDDPAFKPMHVVYVLEKNMTGGKVRATLISTDPDIEEYLFEQKQAYDNMDQCASLFMANYAEGEYHDVRGLGKKIFAHVDASNRVMNSIVDSTFIQNTLLLTGSSEAVHDVMRIQRLGPFTVIPDALEISSQSLNPRMDGAIGVRNLMQQGLNSNTGVNKTQPETGSVARVAADVRYRAAKEKDFTSNERMIFYSQWDWYHIETMRRLLNPDYPATWDGKDEAEQFKTRCVARGVPNELLKSKNLKVTARQSLGVGSSLDRETSTQELVKLAPSMPEQNAYLALRDRCAVLVGHSNVNRYFPSKRNQVATNDHSVAQLENNDMMEGSITLVGSDQSHTIHLDIHLQKMIEIGEQYQTMPDQVDVGQLARYFVAALEHCIQHNAIAEANPVLKDDAALYADTIKAMAKIRDELIREAGALQKQQQEAQEQVSGEAQQEEDPELRMKLERHAVDMRLRIDAARSKEQLKKEMQDSTIRMREVKEAHRMAMQRLRGS